MVRAFCALVVLAGCTELTSIGPERLPPPEREDVLEGRLEGSTDSCAALTAEPPIRITATPGDSEGARLGVVALEDGDSLIGVAWIERGTEESPGDRIWARFFLQDGAQLNPPVNYAAERPTSLTIFPLQSVGAFGLAWADDAGTTLVPAPEWSLPDFAEVPEYTIVGSSAPSGIALDDRLLLASVGPDANRDGEGDTIEIMDVTLSVPPIETPYTIDVAASNVALSPRGTGARLIWIHDRRLYGASIDADNDWAPRERVEPADSLPLVTTALRSAASPGGAYVPLVVEQTVGFTIWRQDTADEWTLWGGWPTSWWEPRDLSIALEHNGARLAVTRVASAAEGLPGVVVLERAALRNIGGFCLEPTDCIDVAIDGRPPFAPEVAAIQQGYAVVWSAEVDGQTDVFYSRIRCRSVTVPG